MRCHRKVDGVRRIVPFLLLCMLVLARPVVAANTQSENVTVLEVYQSGEDKGESNGRLCTRGVGYPPRNVTSLSQKRLLAKRAATVCAYRNMALALHKMSHYLEEGTGIITVDGYIKGARVTRIRYFSDGGVEVEIVLPVTVKQSRQVLREIIPDGYRLCEIDDSPEEITEEAWMELTSR